MDIILYSQSESKLHYIKADFGQGFSGQKRMLSNVISFAREAFFLGNDPFPLVEMGISAYNGY